RDSARELFEDLRRARGGHLAPLLELALHRALLRQVVHDLHLLAGHHDRPPCEALAAGVLLLDDVALPERRLLRRQLVRVLPALLARQRAVLLHVLGGPYRGDAESLDGAGLEQSLLGDDALHLRTPVLELAPVGLCAGIGGVHPLELGHGLLERRVDLLRAPFSEEGITTLIAAVADFSANLISGAADAP